MPLPTFIIAGSPKCGTTALWAYLNEHPDVCMARNKEPRFFSKVDGQLGNGLTSSGPIRSGRFNKGFKWYESLFDHCKDAKAFGEASTHYFSAVDSVDMIKASIPNVRLILMLRDPVERLYSHYWQEYRLGLHFPTFETMVKKNQPRFQWYSFISSYKIHLEKYYSNFKEDQILILLMDDLKENRLEIYQKVCHFIGVDGNYFPSIIGKRQNQQTLPKTRAIEKLLTTAQQSRFADRIPDRFRSSLGMLRGMVSKINSKYNQYPLMPATIRSDLLERFETHIVYVENLLDRKLNSWRKV